MFRPENRYRLSELYHGGGECGARRKIAKRHARRPSQQSAGEGDVAPGLEGDILTAIAKEQYHGGRSGIYDATVTNQKGETIAEFRGHSRSVKGQHIPDSEL